MEMTGNKEMTDHTNLVFQRIDEVFEKQKKHKFSQRKTSAKERLLKLKQFKRLVVQAKEEICQAVHQDFHKPEVEVELTEVMPVISMINVLEKELEHWMRPRYFETPLVYTGSAGWVQPEGKGNCLIISPWNYPFQLCLYPVLTAFAAGNTSMVKPSEFTPHTNKIITELLSKVFTANEVAVFEGEKEVSAHLLNKPFDHIFFTGSTPVGKIVMAHAAKHLASVALELGGKSPAVIDPQADIDEAAHKILWGKMVNGGQTCVAPDYVLLHEEQKNSFVSALKKHLQEFYQGQAYDKNKDYNHIITERHAERLKHLISEAVEKGAKIEVGGNQYENSRVVPPTVLSGVTKDMEVMQDEIFGPVLPIVTYKNEEEAIDFINSYDNALAMYIFSKRKDFYQKLVDNTTNGGVTINDTLVAVGHPTLPFGGAGKSGIGKYHGHFGFEEFSNMRPILHRKRNLGLSYFYPPYNEQKTKVVKALMKKFNWLF